MSRFAFGRNWRSFLDVLTDERIAQAERSLKQMLGERALPGAAFIDVGSGSGLFSLAAARLGAARVHSFDYDSDSVACTAALRQRYAPAGVEWTVERGSILDRPYVAALGQWDVVYSWGVLHHTGEMWPALENVATLVKPSGLLFIAIYNDQGRRSDAWKAVKRLYNRGPLGKAAVISLFYPYYVARGLLSDAVRLRDPRARYREYARMRGMSMVHDWKDWLGGYPFEVAKPEELFDFYRVRGFRLERLTTWGGGLGCNELVLRREPAGGPHPAAR